MLILHLSQRILSTPIYSLVEVYVQSILIILLLARLAILLLATIQLHLPHKAQHVYDSSMRAWPSQLGSTPRHSRIDNRAVALPAMDFSGRGPVQPTFELPPEVQRQLPPDIRNRLKKVEKEKQAVAFPFLQPTDSGDGDGQLAGSKYVSGKAPFAAAGTSKGPLPPVKATTSKFERSDRDVKRRLRRYTAPIALFGETSAERRRRLEILEATQKLQGVSLNDAIDPTDNAFGHSYMARKDKARHAEVIHGRMARAGDPSIQVKHLMKPTSRTARTLPATEPLGAVDRMFPDLARYATGMGTVHPSMTSAVHPGGSESNYSKGKHRKNVSVEFAKDESASDEDASDEEIQRPRRKHRSHRHDTWTSSSKSKSQSRSKSQYPKKSVAQRALEKESIPPHYKTLGVSRGATQEQIKAVYKQLIPRLQERAEAAGSEHMREAALKRLLEVEDAYELLRYPTVRAKYDKFFDDPDTMSNLSADDDEAARAVALQAGLSTPGGGEGDLSENFYEVLGVVQASPPEAIEYGYKQAASTLRDMRKTAWTAELRAQAAANLATVKQAYAVLRDPSLRKEYDKAIGGDSSGDDVDHYAASFAKRRGSSAAS